MRFLIPLVLAFSVTACSGGADNSGYDLGSDLQMVSLRATAEIVTPEKTKMAAFLPNPVETENAGFFLSLPGHILLLSDTGQLWGTTTESEPPRKISDQTFSDLTAFITPEGDGYVLTKSKSGTLGIFTRSTSNEDLEQATLSYGGEAVDLFCKSGAYFVSVDGNLHKFTGQTRPSGIVELSSEPVDDKNPAITACYADGMRHLAFNGTNKRQKDWSVLKGNDPDRIKHSAGLSDLSPLSDTVYLALAAQTHQPLLIKDETLSQLQVDDGLSIRGLMKVDFVAVTHRAMGTTFSDGLILLGDQTENRIVMISLEYAQRELTAATATD